MLSDTAASASTAAAAAAAPVAERWQAAEARRYLALRSSLAGSILLAVAFLIDLTPFSAPGFGRSQLLAAAAGAAALGLGGALALPVGRRLPAVPSPSGRSSARCSCSASASTRTTCKHDKASRRTPRARSRISSCCRTSASRSFRSSTSRRSGAPTTTRSTTDIYQKGVRWMLRASCSSFSTGSSTITSRSPAQRWRMARISSAT
jgi:hypothetical protein